MEQQQQEQQQQLLLQQQQQQEQQLRAQLEQQQQQVDAAAQQAEVLRRQAVGPIGGGMFDAARQAVEAGGVRNVTAKELRDALHRAPTFDEAKTTQGFRHHLVRFKKWMALYGIVSDCQSKLALVYTIEGASAMRIRHLDVDSQLYQQTVRYDDFEQLVVEVFHPQSERNLARAEFLARKQAAEEDVAAYFSVKTSLFRVAVAGNEEQEFPLLLEETVAGLYATPIKRAVWARAPRTVEELRRAILETTGMERIAFQRGFGQVTSLDGLLSVTGAQEALKLRRQQRQNQVEPMEIDQIGARGRSERRSIEGRKFEGNCFYCKMAGHQKRDCPKRKAGEKRCFWCTSPKHLANACPVRAAGKPKVRVNQVEVTEDPEDVDLSEMTEEEIEQFLEEESVNMMGMERRKGQRSGFRQGSH